MHPQNEKPLEQRVIRAAEAALAHHGYASAIDVLTGMGLLEATHVEAWRNGRIDFLERVIQGNLKKISFSMAAFRGWAQAKGLQPSETAYLCRTRTGTRDLQFSKTGDPSIEKLYRTHFVSPEISERKRKSFEARLCRTPERVVFQIVRDSRCAECDAELPKGSLLSMEAGQPLCLPCVRLGDLEYLPAGDAALTRRASKYSGRRAVVVRFSRSRGRYERHGILVERRALQRAEHECTEDADERAAVRARGAEVRRNQDRALVKRMTERLSALFPGCPREDAYAIARHTAARSSGRVGRTAAGRDLDEEALAAAVAAAIRHTRTDYDGLLAQGLDRSVARDRVADAVRAIQAAWKQ